MFNIFKRKNKELTYFVCDGNDDAFEFHDHLIEITIYGKTKDDVLKEYAKNKKFHESNGYRTIIERMSWR